MLISSLQLYIGGLGFIQIKHTEPNDFIIIIIIIIIITIFFCRCKLALTLFFRRWIKLMSEWMNGKIIRKHLRWSFCLKDRLQLIKKGLLKNHIFFPVKSEKFFRTILSRTTFGKCFCFMGWPGPALSKQQVFDLAH